MRTPRFRLGSSRVLFPSLLSNCPLLVLSSPRDAELNQRAISRRASRTWVLGVSYPFLVLTVPLCLCLSLISQTRARIWNRATIQASESSRVHCSDAAPGSRLLDTQESPWHAFAVDGPGPWWSKSAQDFLTSARDLRVSRIARPMSRRG